MNCVDCGREWAWGPNECEWFKAEGLELPRRCKPCRATRRATRGHERVFRGRVAFVDLVRGHGFLETTDGQIFFRLEDAPAGALTIGAHVTFTLGNRATGRLPRASLIKPLKEARP